MDDRTYRKRSSLAKLQNRCRCFLIRYDFHSLPFNRGQHEINGGTACRFICRNNGSCTGSRMPLRLRLLRKKYILKNFRLYFLVLFIFLTSLVHGQPFVNVLCKNDAAIGTINAGCSLLVPANSPFSAKFLIHSARTIEIMIQFILPRRMSGADGTEGILLSFGPDYARWSSVDNVSAAASFDPQVPLKIHVEANQNVYLWVGILANAPADGRAGKYYGSITCTVQQISQ